MKYYNNLAIPTLFTLFLLSFLIGNAAINLISTIFFFFLLYKYFYFIKIREKKFFKTINIKSKLWSLAIILSAYILITSYYSLEPDDSISRSLTFIKTILILFLFNHFFHTENHKKISKYFVFIFLVFISYIIFTTIFQSITGRSFIRDYYTVVNRLSGPFGDELIVGTVIAKMSFLCFYILKKIINVNKLFYFFVIILFSFCIFISGERSALLLYFIYLTIYFLILTLNRRNFKLTFYFFISILFIISTFSYHLIKSDYFYHYKNNNLENLMYNKDSEFYKNKFLWLFDRHIMQSYNEIKNSDESDYFKLFKSGYLIWKDDLFFGVGLKNFRHECPKKLSQISNKDDYSCNIHPHNFLLELLSELGIFGFLLFSIFMIALINKFFFFKDYLAWFTIFIQLTPMVNASFFTTFNLNLFMMSFIYVIICTNYYKRYLNHFD